MTKFIEIPVILLDNDPDDDTDYEALNIKPDHEKEVVPILLNVDGIDRVNPSIRGDYKTVIWVLGNSTPYQTPLDYDEVKKLILE